MTDASDITVEPSGGDRFRTACDAVGACGGRVEVCRLDGVVTCAVTRLGCSFFTMFDLADNEEMFRLLSAWLMLQRDRMIGLVEVER